MKKPDDYQEIAHSAICIRCKFYCQISPKPDTQVHFCSMGKFSTKPYSTCGKFEMDNKTQEGQANDSLQTKI